MMEVEEAVALLQAAAVPIRDTVVVDILDARGCVAAGDILSPIAVPRFAKSAMDGYALRAVDTAGASRQSPVRLRVLGEGAAVLRRRVIGKGFESFEVVIRHLVAFAFRERSKSRCFADFRAINSL